MTKKKPKVPGFRSNPDPWANYPPEVKAEWRKKGGQVAQLRRSVFRFKKGSAKARIAGSKGGYALAAKRRLAKLNELLSKDESNGTGSDEKEE